MRCRKWDHPRSNQTCCVSVAAVDGVREPAHLGARADVPGRAAHLVGAARLHLPRRRRLQRQVRRTQRHHGEYCTNVCTYLYLLEQTACACTHARTHKHVHTSETIFRKEKRPLSFWTDGTVGGREHRARKYASSMGKSGVLGLLGLLSRQQSNIHPRQVEVSPARSRVRPAVSDRRKLFPILYGRGSGEKFPNQ